MAPEICPNCGACVPPEATACPECGSDEETGWSEAARTAELDLPDEEFDYEEFTAREFGSEKAKPPRGISLLWWVIAILILGIIALLCLH